VPDLDDEQSGQPVQDLPALVVPDVGALPARDHRDGDLRVAALAGEVHPEVVRGAGRRRVGYAGREVLDRSGHPRLLMASIGKGVRRSGEAQGDAPWLESSEREVRTTLPRDDIARLLVRPDVARRS
jgi:hypothetical protein